MSEDTAIAFQRIAEDGGTADLLVRWRSALLRTSPAAEDAARAGVFAEYRRRQRASTLDRLEQDLILFARFISAAVAAGRPPLGAEDRRAELMDEERFGRVLGEEPQAWAGVGAGHVAAFAPWLLAAGYAIASVNHALATVKVFARLAMLAGVISEAEQVRIQALRGYTVPQGRSIDAGRPQTRRSAKKATPTAITPEIARRLKREQPDTPQGCRDAALLAILLDHGLRCGEITLLRVEHLTRDADGRPTMFTFDRPKVAMTQTHRLTPDARLAMIRYLAARRVVDPAERGPLFCATGKDGALRAAGLSERAIYQRVGVLAARVGLPDLGPHDCRHYWATQAVRHGTDIRALQDAGGWASPTMPLRYAQRAAVANDGVRLGTDETGEPIAAAPPDVPASAPPPADFIIPPPDEDLWSPDAQKWDDPDFKPSDLLRGLRP